MQSAVVPAELDRLFSESARAHATWASLEEIERASMIDFVASAREPEVRERRATLVLLTLATKH